MKSTLASKDFGWRHAVLVILVVAPFGWMLSFGPIPQEVTYHSFEDTRGFLDIPNFLNVISNLPFLLVGVVGVRFCLKSDLGQTGKAWLTLFVGVSLVSFGSAYYHLNPGNETLVWDRLPMTIGFMGLLGAILGEYVHARWASRLLVPLIILGIGSVLYWWWFDDLRLYLWVQFVPLLLLPFVMVLFRCCYTRQWLLIVALAGYGLAKLAELNDAVVLESTGGMISGHTLKHLLAAASCYFILMMLQQRKPKE